MKPNSPLTHFKSIESEDAAYWLGFFTADGCVSDCGIIALGLSSIDFSHLEKFKDFIGTSNKITTYYDKRFGSGYSTVRFRNKGMAADLAEYGVVPRKTGNCKYYYGIRSDLERHYCRGLVDGDGFIGANGDIGICGDVDVVEGFSIYCQKICDVRCGVNKVKGKPESFRNYVVSDYNARDIIYELYRDCSVYLERKKLLADRFSVYQFQGSRRRTDADKYIHVCPYDPSKYYVDINMSNKGKRIRSTKRSFSRKEDAREWRDNKLIELMPRIAK